MCNVKFVENLMLPEEFCGSELFPEQTQQFFFFSSPASLADA